jgi:hypothetical protein
MEVEEEDLPGGTAGKAESQMPWELGKPLETSDERFLDAGIRG